MSAQHTLGPYKRLALRCEASGQNFYSYGNADRGVKFDAPCPVCGKPVKLMRLRGSPVKFPHIVPMHNRVSIQDDRVAVIQKAAGLEGGAA